MNLSYTTTKNSYTILNDTTAWIVQSNLVPYSFPYARESVEESAQAHIDAILESDSKQGSEASEIEQLKQSQISQDAAIFELAEVVTEISGGN